MFNSLFATQVSFNMTDVLICLGAALVCGLVYAVAYMFSGAHTKSFVTSLVLLPITVATVILVANQSFGVALAIGGLFAVIRFRSAPGTAREITAMFAAVAAGTVIGMGYVVLGAVFTVLTAVVILVLGITPFGKNSSLERHLKVLVPESLDYTDIFNDVLKNYTTRYSLDMVKTTNMGSMYEAHYTVSLRNAKKEKEMIDALRERNGNLPITCATSMSDQKYEL